MIIPYRLTRFGMAEQAINTIYLLGEHPDHLCNELIKNFTRRAFSRQSRLSSQPNPDAMDEDLHQDESSVAKPTASQGSQTSQGPHDDIADAFQLSQLIFVVGHVAIKHIVFLEFVEKEWKRQKEEREKEDKEKSKGENWLLLT